MLLSYSFLEPKRVCVHKDTEYEVNKEFYLNFVLILEKPHVLLG